MYHIMYVALISVCSIVYVCTYIYTYLALCVGKYVIL